MNNSNVFATVVMVKGVAADIIHFVIPLSKKILNIENTVVYKIQSFAINIYSYLYTLNCYTIYQPKYL